MSIKELRKALRAAAIPGKKEILQKFFKTGPGEYAEGDVFLGVVVPDTRRIAKKFIGISEKDILILLKSRIHEERLAALLILVERFSKASHEERQKIINLYLMNVKYVNNWDLVDLTAPKLLGEFLLDKDRDVLDSLANSRNIWERRIAMVATYAFIRKGEYADTLRLAATLLEDKHDLIHKAMGWMLREVGKKDQKMLERFLNKYAAQMPRTALRYAIERFPEERKDNYKNIR